MFMQLHQYSETVGKRVDASAHVHFSGEDSVFIRFSGVTLHNVKNHENGKH